jgi:hypothetical protein
MASQEQLSKGRRRRRWRRWVRTSATRTVRSRAEGSAERGQGYRARVVIGRHPSARLGYLPNPSDNPRMNWR